MALATFGGEGASWPPESIVVPEGQKHPPWQSLQATHPGNTPLFWCQGSRGDFPFIRAPAPWVDLPKKRVRSVHPTLAAYIFTSGVFSFYHILYTSSSLRALEHLFLFNSLQTGFQFRLS